MRGLRLVWEKAKRPFWGTGGLPWVGCAIILVGAVFFASILMSPGEWGWWMHAKAVRGYEQGGLVIYTVGGRNYSVDDPRSMRSGPRTVYIVPSDPSDGSLAGRATQLTDWATTVGPGVLGAICVGLGFVHKRRSASRNVRATASSFGDGLDSAHIRQLLEYQRRDSQSAVRPPPAGTDPQ